MNTVAETTRALRIASDLIRIAQTEGKVSGRSAGGQVEHWARIGRAIEQMPGMTLTLQRQALEEGFMDPEELTDNVDVIAALRGEQSVLTLSAAERDLFDEVLGMLTVSPVLAKGFERVRAENAAAQGIQ